MIEYQYTFYHHDNFRMDERNRKLCEGWILEHNSLAFTNLYQGFNRRDPKFNPEGLVYFPDHIEVFQDGKRTESIPVKENFNRINKVICESGK